MFRLTDDLRIRDVRPLIPPAILLEEIPLSERASNVVAEARTAITNVVHGDDPRLIAVVGPCSIHDTAAALEYARRLAEVATPLGDSLVVVMRAYFEKPRTVVGWKGLVNDPDLDGLETARHEHWFPGVTKQGISAILRTAGNDDCHLILRGGTQTGPNYDAAHVAAACAELTARSLPGIVMVDCSHGNSQRDHRRQGVVAADVCRQVASGSRQICGIMLESQLVEERQDYEPGRELIRGQSITDACISIEETAVILEQLANAQHRRARLHP